MTSIHAFNGPLLVVSHLQLVREFKEYCPSCQISEMERGEDVSPSPKPEPNPDKKKSERGEVTASSSDKRDSSLRVEDLDNPPLSPVPDSHSSTEE